MTDRNPKSGKEVAKPKSAGRSKADARYWTDRVSLPTYTKGGERRTARHYAARIAVNKRRHTFTLGTANKDTAAKTAARIFEAIISDGWEAALAKYAPSHAAKKSATVGDLIRAAETCASVARDTLADYARAFRHIVADIEGISSVVEIEKGERILDPVTGKHRIKRVKTTKDVRFDYVSKAGKVWRERVDAVALDRITPAKVNLWKLAYVRENGSNDFEAERRAKNTCNSKLRQAKGLFSKRIIPHIRHALDLPETLPFDGLEFWPRQSMRYNSKINAPSLIRCAVDELAESEPESFKIFILGIMGGLRAKEIDSLLWRQIDFEAGTVTVEATPYFKPKAETSIGVVQFDAETVQLLRGYRARSKSEFVIESKHAPRPMKKNRERRAKEAFSTLYDWLKKNGVTASKPLHELRKEFGSILCQRGGLYAASRALRHAGVAITAAHYLDEKERATVGLGQFLTPAAKTEGEAIVDIAEGRKVG